MSMIHGVSQNRLDHLKGRSMLESHLFAYGSVLVVCATIVLSCSFSMIFFTLWMNSSCWVDVGGMEGWYDVR